ncbi:hypothetical protein OAF98_02765 [Planctomicrobium sp.]|jgi:hypothetical protein|nr:DUF6754 domain-containing protein [Planctomicrobium sp.]MDB4439382.1 hypothetical protein [Planctomicrobium sp.]MDB4743383.1 hypothetical protein [Planctomicrobium sp.]
MKRHVSLWFLLTLISVVGNFSANFVNAQLTAPLSVEAQDHPLDDGTNLDVIIKLPENVSKDIEYVIEKSAEYNGLYTEIAKVKPTAEQVQAGQIEFTSTKNFRGEEYWFRVAASQKIDGELQNSAFVATPQDSPGVGSLEFLDGGRIWLAIITVLVCGSVIAFIMLARQGRELKVRPIAGLEAIEEAVGRATEMGRACLFVPGIQDMNDIQTIAGLTILSKVAEQAAEYDCLLETPTSKSLVMTAARETVATAFMKAGRPDAYNNDLIYYVTDEQFAYVSFLTGKMVREKPAACFYLGAFFAESLILAETGNSVGAIQIAGTAQPAQLPFFVAACDYTLIGEEFFAASAYLSGDPDQLGSLKGQDVGKLIVGGLILLGVFLVTMMEVTNSPMIANAAKFLMDTVLQSV